MAYLIYKSDGTSISIPDNSIDPTYYNSGGGGGFGPGNVPQSGHGLGTQLIGRNAVDYGAAIAQNFLQLTENFSSSTVPSDTYSLQGQLWFNQAFVTAGELYVRVAVGTGLGTGIANWERLVTVAGSGTTPTVNPSVTPVNGDIRLVGNVISIYNTAGTIPGWQQIFPAVYS